MILPTVKVLLLPFAVLLIAIYLYPVSIVHIAIYPDIPSDPHYPYYVVLYPGETLVGKISVLPVNTTILYLKVRGTVYDKWEPRILSKGSFEKCIFRVEGVECAIEHGQKHLYVSGESYIDASPVEIFNDNSTDAIHLARHYEAKGDVEKAISIYQAIGGHGAPFFPMYRMAVIGMNMTQFLATYYAFPHRKEPLYYLARHYRTLGNYSHCLLYARAGLLVGSPAWSDAYIEKPIYEYALELEFAHCLYHSGRQEEAINQWKRVLPQLPEAQRAEIVKFLEKEEKK